MDTLIAYGVKTAAILLKPLINMIVPPTLHWDLAIIAMLFLVPLFLCSLIALIVKTSVILIFAPRRNLPHNVTQLSTLRMETWYYYRFVMKADKAFKPYGRAIFATLQLIGFLLAQYAGSKIGGLFFPNVINDERIIVLLIIINLLAFSCLMLWGTRFFFNLCTRYCPDPENGPWKKI